MKDGPTVIQLELHQNPDQLEEWAISFCYDHVVPSLDADIIYVGSLQEMQVKYDNNKTWIAQERPEYFDTLKRFKE